MTLPETISMSAGPEAIADAINLKYEPNGITAAVSDPALCRGWTAGSQRCVMINMHDATGWCAIPKILAVILAVGVCTQ